MLYFVLLNGQTCIVALYIKPEIGVDTVEQVLVMMLQSKVVCHFLDDKRCLDLGLKTIGNKTTDDRPRYILGPS